MQVSLKGCTASSCSQSLNPVRPQQGAGVSAQAGRCAGQGFCGGAQYSIEHLLPAVAKAWNVIDGIEGRVTAPEPVSQTPDCGPHVRSISLGSASCDETLIM